MSGVGIGRKTGRPRLELVMDETQERWIRDAKTPLGLQILLAPKAKGIFESSLVVLGNQ